MPLKLARDDLKKPNASLVKYYQSLIVIFFQIGDYINQKIYFTFAKVIEIKKTIN